MAAKQTLITKSNEIVAKFFEGIPTTPDTSWLTARNAAGELLKKRAALKHCTTAEPSKTEVAMALAEEAKNPDATSKALYKVQAIHSEAQFASFKTALASGGQ